MSSNAALLGFSALSSTNSTPRAWSANFAWHCPHTDSNCCFNAVRACPSSSPIDDRWLTGDESSIAGSASTATCSRFISASIRGCRLPKGGSVRPTTLTFLPRTFAEFRDLIEELLEELGLAICSGLYTSLSLAFALYQWFASCPCRPRTCGCWTPLVQLL